MMTAIRKRSWTSPKGLKKTAWQVDYKDQQGKRRSRQFATKKEADAYADRARDEIRQGRHTHDRDSITVAVAADLWIAAADAEGLERSTIKRYRELSRLHIVPKFGDLKLSQLSKAQLVEWRQELLMAQSRSMASKIIRALSAILSNAMQIGAISQNVASDVRVSRVKREAKRVEPPARADLKKMIEAATGDERPFILTAITMGLRSSELRGLCWRDIDFNAETQTVRQRADEWGQLGSPKSEAGRRTIPMPPPLVAELKKWKLRCKPTRIGLVFPSNAGTPMRHNNVLRRMYFPLQIRAGLGVPKLDKNGQPKLDNEGNPLFTGKYRFHALRHAAASGWIASKIDLKRLQVWIGHESIQLTLDTYGHLLADHERDAELVTIASRDLFA